MKDHYVFSMKITTAPSKIYLRTTNVYIFTIETFRIWPSNYSGTLSQYPGGNCLTHWGNEKFSNDTRE